MMKHVPPRVAGMFSEFQDQRIADDGRHARQEVAGAVRRKAPQQGRPGQQQQQQALPALPQLREEIVGMAEALLAQKVSVDASLFDVG